MQDYFVTVDGPDIWAAVEIPVRGTLVAAKRKATQEFERDSRLGDRLVVYHRPTPRARRAAVAWRYIGERAWNAA